MMDASKYRSARSFNIYLTHTITSFVIVGYVLIPLEPDHKDTDNESDAMCVIANVKIV